MATPKKRPQKTKPKGKQTTSKTVYYKRARFIPDDTGGQSLADFLDRALAKKKKPSRRLERIGASNDNIRVINKCYIENGMVCGRFLDYTEGGAQAVLEMDDDADELAIKTISPSRREQFLEGILTFGIKSNHVLLVQSKSLQHGHLQNHLNWIMDEAGVLPNGVRLFLEDQPSPEVERRLENVNSITLREDVPSGNLVLETEDLHNTGLGPIITAFTADGAQRP